MGNIVLLDDLTINKIAAGEVIERPASVVKEMLENSIDAGAKNVTIEIKNGGISLIKITDDGQGIAKDDMEIAFERHATSKIRNADDLSTVKSMGFRGEALASIAAISKVEMISKREDEKEGHKIVVEGGKTVEFNEIGRSTGTTITVQNLFYNTPVRYKFLKKDYTEAGYIEDTVTRIALINRDVAIKLISNGKTVVQTNGNGDLKTVVYSIYGKDISLEVNEVDYEYEGIRVTGVVGNPVIARANRTNQLFFLNKRYIKDKNLTAAAEQAYKGIVPVGRYGFLILNLDMDPKTVDVNVHPAKLEVRFEDESKVFKAVYHAIKASLATTTGVTMPDEKNDFSINNTMSNIYEKNNINKENNVDNSYNNEKLINNDKNLNKEETTYESNNQEKKKGIVGLFSKIIKEPEETEEELNNNHLEEVYKNRQLKNQSSINTVDDIDLDNINVTENNRKAQEYINKYRSEKENEEAKKLENDEINKKEEKEETPIQSIPNLSANKEEIKIINEEEISKKVSLGNAVISSDTKELDLSNINEIIKDPTTIMNSTKLLEKELTQIINSTKSNNSAASDLNVDKSNFDETQKVDINLNKNLNQNTVVATENLNSLPQDTILMKNINETPKVVIPSDRTEEIKIEENANLSGTKSEDENNNVLSNNNEEEFSKLAKKLFESKNMLDNTQMIDTNKVRESIKEENFEPNPEFDQMYKKTFGVDTFSVRKEKEQEKIEEDKLNAVNELSYPNNENMTVFDDKETQQPEISYKYIGVIFNTHVAVEIKDEMYIIDQVTAQEKVLYERLKESYYSDEAHNDEQTLLLPDVITVNEKQMNIAKENTRMMAKAGFTFEEFGDNTIKLISVPGICESMNTKQLFLDILNEMDKVAVNDIKEKENKFLSTVASKLASNMKIRTEEQEIKELINELLLIPNPFVVKQHEKPTAVKMSKYDLERKFSRR